ncbi:MAG: hypothetical protein LW832_05280 [Parachlamydia sp.]|jgi:hypothetical protein|nr:hypothetical protein [Parachlamydia sp.]
MKIYNNSKSYNSISNQQLPPHITDSLKTFCDKHCPGVDEKEMCERIGKGEKLIHSLINNDSTIEKSPESVANLMWALTKKCDDQKMLYTSGAMRLQTKPQLDPAVLENFLKSCGAYGRVSTHMSGKNQWGIDCPSLPAEKRTVLFQKLPDGTIYLKMEEHGCPPFWKKGFRNFENFSQFIGHTLDFIRTRIYKSGKSTYPLRKEHVPKKILKQYNLTVNFIFPKEKQSFFNRLMGRKTIEQSANENLRNQFLAEGKKGISSMSRNLDKLKKHAKNLSFEDQLQAETINIYNTGKLLDKRLSMIPHGYEGDIKGKEVPLTLI